MCPGYDSEKFALKMLIKKNIYKDKKANNYRTLFYLCYLCLCNVYSLLLQLAYVKDMLQDPVVSEYLIPKEVFQTFHNAYKVGEKPNYDLLLE